MNWVIDPPAQPMISLRDGGEFPVRRIWCVGRNYADHVLEMGNDLRDPPFFFAKPSDAVIQSSTVPYPPVTKSLHHEVELLVAIGKPGHAVSPEDAPDLIYGAAVAVDLTRRDIQSEAKAAGRPWEMAKGFDASAPVGDLVQISGVSDLTQGEIWLEVNGERRQSGDLSQMIWPVEEIISALSAFVALEPGDVILTGTPAGVSALERGDHVRCGIADLPELNFTIQ